MKPSLFSSILALTIIFCASCEKPHENRAIEKPDQTKDKEPISLRENTAAPGAPEEVHSPVIISPATMNRIFKEADEAFIDKDYRTAIAKTQELLKILGPNRDAPLELLYFNIGLAHLLGEKYPEAVIAFKDSIHRFPKGEYASRAYLGLGRALIFQKQPDLKTEALAAFKKAAEDPRYKTEADQWIDQMSESPANP